MTVSIHPHAQARLVERGATVQEVIETVNKDNRVQPSSTERSFAVALLSIMNHETDLRPSI